MVRTGIDLGTGSVKLVRGEGSPTLERITHVGIEEWDSPETGSEVARASAALQRLLDRLKLNKSRLGPIAVAVSGDEASLREVIMPSLSEAELRQALPFEAQKHLSIEEMVSPLIDFQVLGSVPPLENGGPEQIRVLLAAAPKAQRAFPLAVLSQRGLEPQVVDLEPLASLNGLLATLPRDGEQTGAVALLDLGARYARLHVTQRDGKILTRQIRAGAASAGTIEGLAEFVEALKRRIRDTFTFYRSRYREEIHRVFVCGGGALASSICDVLASALKLPTSILDPLEGLAESAQGQEEAKAAGARFVTACGLCRWWDGSNV